MATFIKKFTGKNNYTINGDPTFSIDGGILLPNECTSLTTDQIVYSINIGSSVFTGGDSFNMYSMINKIGGVNSASVKYYINTSQTLTNAVLVGVYSTSTALRFGIFQRRVYIINQTGTNNTLIHNPSDSSLNDFSGVVSNITVDWTSNIWLLLTCSVVNAADSLCARGFKAYKY